MISQIIYYTWFVLNIILFVFAFFETILMVFAVLAKKKNEILEIEDFPFVTVQLPVYNEKYVVERLIEAIAKLDYPKDKFEVQILDDSTDETSVIIESSLVQYASNGLNIKHVQRTDRNGFKAGALAEGMKVCKGEFIAIFDADFIPDSNFLKRTIPYFKSENTAAVQTRWTHINENNSFLTKAQAIMLNTHFAVEHLGRISSGAFINFNGTAGVWRKSSILDSGGWHSDTLTEDLDLSFRAQAKGWKFIYLFDVESPAELPVTLDAFKTQQYRWSKGAAECVRKNLVSLWNSSSSFWAKLIGSLHLFNSSLYIVVFFLVLLSPVVYWMNQNQLIDGNSSLFHFSNLFITFSIPVMFFVGNMLVSKGKWKSIVRFPLNFYLFLCLSISISLYMMIGVIEGFMGKKSPFVRTPKYNLGNEKKWSNKIKEAYTNKKELKLLVLECLILMYGALVIIVGVKYGSLLIVNFGVMISIGYSLKIFFSKKVF